jgi:hypothetical protein
VAGVAGADANGVADAARADGAGCAGGVPLAAAATKAPSPLRDAAGLA